MKLTELCEELKGLDLNGHLSLWVVHRHLDNARKAVYKVLRVDVEETLQRKLRDLVNSTVRGIDSLARYNYQTPPQDRRVFVLNTTEGGFDPLRTLIEEGTEAPHAGSEKDLLNSFAFIVNVSVPGREPIYAFRKVSDAWTTKKVGGFKGMTTYFNDGMLIDLDNRPVFRIDPLLDFLAWDDHLFILDREAFEFDLNFRERLERNRDEVVKEFETLPLLYTNANVIAEVVGDRLPLLRRMASIRQNEYYKNPEYVKSLIERAGQYGWPIEAKGSRIVVKAETVEILLKLLNNDRLQSPINYDLFDVWGKEKVASAVPMPVRVTPPAPPLTIAPPMRFAAKKSPARTVSAGKEHAR